MKHALHFIVFILSFFAFSVYAQPIVYVTESGAGLKNGTNWSNAYDNTQFQVAIDQAASLATVANPAQVWVARGMYQPARFNYYGLRNNVAVYGGFAGNEISLNQRNYLVNACKIVENDPGVGISMKNIDVNQTAILDGFVFTNHGDIAQRSMIKNEANTTDCKPQIRNCTFTEMYGGGGNYAISSYSGNGWECSPSYSNCVVTKIYGGLFIAGCSADGNGSKVAPQYVNCIFSQNNSSYSVVVNDALNGGSAKSTFTNCLFYTNTSTQPNLNSGGAFTNRVYGSNAEAISTFNNCTLVGNFASGTTGGAIYNYKDMNATGGTCKSIVRNSIIWNNIAQGVSSQIGNSANASADVQYSDIEGGYAGIGNIAANPQFIDQYPSGTNLPDFRLLSQCSPCVNTGILAFVTQATDLDGNSRVYAGAVDMGAYEKAYAIGNYPILYVTTTGAGNKQGTSWANASNNIQFTVEMANCLVAKYGTPVQIWIAKGDYQYNQYGTEVLIKNKVSIYGGFIGTESSLSQRNFRSNPTNIRNRVRFVMNSVSSATVIDGLVLMPGIGDYLNETPQIAVDAEFGNSSPIIRNCKVTGKGVTYSYAIQTSSANGYRCSPTFINCQLIQNERRWLISNYAIGTNSINNATYINCLYANNSVWSGPDNRAFDGGTTNTNYINCTIAANDFIFSNASFLNDNTAIGPMGTMGAVQTTLKNCIVWGNTYQGNPATISNIGTASSEVQYSDMEGGYAGTGNLNANPQFVNPTIGDFHLYCNSPCIGTGLNVANTTTTDLDDRPRIVGTTIDMGVYEGGTLNNFSASTKLACLGGTLSLLSSVAGGTYTWSGPANFASSIQNPSFSPVTTAQLGVYFVTASTTLGCSGTATVSTSIFVASASSNAPVCTGTILKLNAINADSYLWSGPNGFSSTKQSPELPNMTIGMAGLYGVVVRYSICVASVMVQVTAAQTPDASFKVTTLDGKPIVNGSTVILTANGAGYFDWRNPLGLPIGNLKTVQITNFSNSKIGNYTLRVTNVSCSAMSTQKISLAARLASEESVTNGIEVLVKGNPTPGRFVTQINLQNPAPVELTWLSLDGQALRNWSLESESQHHEIELNVTEYKEGMYLLRVQANGQGKTVRVLKVE
ncbi:MAG: choice-of-anchor Q domain-containing protein [Spirosomataceae bacterium]